MPCLGSVPTKGISANKQRWPLTQRPSGLRRAAGLLRVLITFSFPARFLDPKKWTVQLGQLTSKPSFWNREAFSGRYRVKDIIINSEDKLKYHDLALLRLASSVTYNKFIQPVCVLPSASMSQHQPRCWVTGWGALQEDLSEISNRGWACGCAISALRFSHSRP